MEDLCWSFLLLLWDNKERESWCHSPCFLSPDRFALLLVDEPRALLQDFLERFQNLCQLELQLPSLRAEDMKNMVSFWGGLWTFESLVTKPDIPVCAYVNVISLAFSMDVPCGVAFTWPFSKHLKRSLEGFPLCKLLPRAGTSDLCHHDAVSGNRAEALGSCSAPLLA